MLGRGRYAQHEQLRCDPDIDDSLDGIDVDSYHSVMYIGQEYIPNFNEQNYNILVEKIYGRSFSPLEALTQSRKLDLSVDHDGIYLYNPPVKGSTRILCMSYRIPELVYLSTAIRHGKVLALVCIDSTKTKGATLSVFVCKDEDEPGIIMDTCTEIFAKKQSVQNINNLNSPRSLKIFYDHQEKVKTTEFTTTQNITQENDVKTGDFGEFQTALESSTNPVLAPQNPLVDFDDEFSELAMKRNVYLPDHLQDKTIESTCFIQDQQQQQPKHHYHYTQQKQQQQQQQQQQQHPSPGLMSPTREDNTQQNFFFKSGLFSSYSRVSTG